MKTPKHGYFLLPLILLLVIVSTWVFTSSSSAVVQELKSYGHHLESIRAIVQSNSKLQIEIRSERIECKTGDCIYRVYLRGDSLFGGYAFFNHEARMYQIAFQLYKSDSFQLLVALEAVKNASQVVGPIQMSALDYKPGQRSFAISRRVSEPFARVNVSIVTAKSDPLLKRCRYNAGSFRQDIFEWIRRDSLLKQGFTSNETLIIPSERLDPTHNSTHYSQNQHFHPKWLQAYQDYVYHGRTCRQKWINHEEIEGLIAREGQIHLVGVGTSRLREPIRALAMLGLKEKHLQGFRVSYLFSPTRSSQPEAMTRVLKRLFEAKEICKDENTTTVFVVSHGIWEAKYHYATQPSEVFRFDKNAENTIHQIQQQCQGQKYRIVIMTQPSTHPFDGRIDTNIVKQNNFTLPTSLTGPMLQVVNWAWLKVAKKFNLPIIDIERASYARREDCFDNLHYRLVDDKTHKRIAIKVNGWAPDQRHWWPMSSSATSTAFSQLVLAGIFEAFEI